MGKRYIVAPGHEFNYPADSTSLRLVMAVGGRTKLKPEQLDQVKFKTVRAGEDCSDMPPGSLEIYLERGWVIEGEPKEVTP